MTDNNSSGGEQSRRDRINKDADTVAGFFGTRGGAIFTASVVAAIVVIAVLAWVFGW